jgi:hypothetical protein
MFKNKPHSFYLPVFFVAKSIIFSMEKKEGRKLSGLPNLTRKDKVLYEIK